MMTTVAVVQIGRYRCRQMIAEEPPGAWTFILIVAFIAVACIIQDRYGRRNSS
jgi:hypothetical protein